MEFQSKTDQQRHYFTMKKAGKLLGKQEKTKEMGSGTENVSIKISGALETFRMVTAVSSTLKLSYTIYETLFN